MEPVTFSELTDGHQELHRKSLDAMAIKPLEQSGLCAAVAIIERRGGWAPRRHRLFPW